MRQARCGPVLQDASIFSGEEEGARGGKRKVGARVHACVKKTCVRRVPQGARKRARQEAAALETPPPPKGLARLLSCRRVSLSPSPSSAQLWPWRLRTRHPSRLARNGLPLRQRRRRCRATRTWSGRSLVARALRFVTPGGNLINRLPANCVAVLWRLLRSPYPGS